MNIRDDGWYVVVDGIRTDFKRSEGYRAARDFFTSECQSKPDKEVALCREDGTVIDCAPSMLD